MKRVKYFLVYLLPVTVYFAFQGEGIWSFLPVGVFFVLVPLLELMIKADHSNFDEETALLEKNSVIYDWILYLAVPVQLGMLLYYFNVISVTPLNSLEFYGRVFAMGLMCGVMGINIGHELGHRPERLNQFLGEVLLLTSLNTHFLPYHNEGHHREVATPDDPATAGRNQLLFHFWVDSHFGSYAKAWKIENNRMKKKGKPVFSIENRMVVYSIANVALLVLIYNFYGIKVLLAFLLSAVVGILLLETVNYIEHYGLLRKKNDKGRYERVRNVHSWNSDHQIGRLMLFNLSRHSDHHYKASKKYQVLESLEGSPQMPTGYPGMMVLALVQPIWFRLMNRKLDGLFKDTRKP
jgi:alkane 1-monooxygenase